jgi:hypothetical protein
MRDLVVGMRALCSKEYFLRIGSQLFRPMEFSTAILSEAISRPSK